MGYNKRGVRDGTGPYKGSWQKKKVGIGRRRQADQPCPKRGKK